ASPRLSQASWCCAWRLRHWRVGACSRSESPLSGQVNRREPDSRSRRMNEGSSQALTAGQARRLNEAFSLLQQGKANDALSIALNMTKQVRRSPDAWHLLALCHKAKGNSPDALEAFQQALALAPANPHILGNYANLLKSLGRIDEALPF